MIDEYHFRFFAVQQNADGFLAKLVICGGGGGGRQHENEKKITCSVSTHKPHARSQNASVYQRRIINLSRKYEYMGTTFMPMIMCMPQHTKYVRTYVHKRTLD